MFCRVHFPPLRLQTERLNGSSNCYVVLWKGRGSAYLFLDAFGSVMCCAFLPQVKFEQYPNLIFSSRVTLCCIYHGVTQMLLKVCNTRYVIPLWSGLKTVHFKQLHSRSLIHWLKVPSVIHNRFREAEYRLGTCIINDLGRCWHVRDTWATHGDGTWKLAPAPASAYTTCGQYTFYSVWRIFCILFHFPGTTQYS